MAGSETAGTGNAARPNIEIPARSPRRQTRTLPLSGGNLEYKLHFINWNKYVWGAIGLASAAATVLSVLFGIPTDKFRDNVLAVHLALIPILLFLLALTVALNILSILKWIQYRRRFLDERQKTAEYDARQYNEQIKRALVLEEALGEIGWIAR